MTGDEPVPRPAPAAIEMQPPNAEHADQRTHRQRIQRRGGLAAEAEDEGRGEQPQAAEKAEPLSSPLLAAEADVGGDSEEQAGHRGVGGRCTVRRVIGKPGGHGEPQRQREAGPVLPAAIFCYTGLHAAWTGTDIRAFARPL
jgi:hypothetical protein